MTKIYATKEDLIADVGPILYEDTINGKKLYVTKDGVYSEFDHAVDPSPTEGRARDAD